MTEDGSIDRLRSQHSYLDGRTAELVSQKGTVRGIRNRVRSSIFRHQCQQKGKNKIAEEKNKVVIYVTSMSVIRDTYEKCHRVTKILYNHRIQYEFRDVSVSRDYLQELKERLDTAHPSIPQVFAGGLWLGKVDPGSFTCDDCGGYGFVPCTYCKGSKKSTKVESALVSLKCIRCDKTGLMHCPACKEA
ncbi:hypothetical protein EB796_000754 [Bugula neritina]|uniref:Glutaredoxin domain-containing protein n=1 Tax=Bugula neritina TaxID=10212 RepID=A0A7J7KS45_BUGNE|nr:hypothetical protein EB796_000754 [Bugula neritina]